MIQHADLAFIGTVADQREIAGRNDFGDAMRQYAFRVERATAPVDAVMTIVAGTGGASCGITFANGEEWLILTYVGSSGLETNLCSGDLRMSDVGPAERAAILELLPSVARPPSVEPESLFDSIIASGPIIVGGAILVLVAMVGLLAFRRAT